MLATLRSWLFKLLFYTATLIWAVLILAMVIFPYRVRHRLATGWADTSIFLARWVAGIRYEVVGREHLTGAPGIMVLNHQSSWETLFTPLLLRDQVWVLKKELVTMPVFGWAMGLLRPIAIDRKKRKSAMVQLIEQGRDRLRRGFWVVIYPEGTRTEAEHPLPFRSGAARLAVELGTRVVPMAHNAGQFWPKKGRTHAGTVKVVIFPPLTAAEGETPAEFNHRLQTLIHKQVAELVAAEHALRHPSPKGANDE